MLAYNVPKDLGATRVELKFATILKKAGVYEMYLRKIHWSLDWLAIKTHMNITCEIELLTKDAFKELYNQNSVQILGREADQSELEEDYLDYIAMSKSIKGSGEPKVSFYKEDDGSLGISYQLY